MVSMSDDRSGISSFSDMSDMASDSEDGIMSISSKTSSSLDENMSPRGEGSINAYHGQPPMQRRQHLQHVAQNCLVSDGAYLQIQEQIQELNSQARRVSMRIIDLDDSYVSAGIAKLMDNLGFRLKTHINKTQQKNACGFVAAAAARALHFLPANNWFPDDQFVNDLTDQTMIDNGIILYENKIKAKFPDACSHGFLTPDIMSSLVHLDDQDTSDWFGGVCDVEHFLASNGPLLKYLTRLHKGGARDLMIFIVTLKLSGNKRFLGCPEGEAHAITIAVGLTSRNPRVIQSKFTKPLRSMPSGRRISSSTPRRVSSTSMQ